MITDTISEVEPSQHAIAPDLIRQINDAHAECERAAQSAVAHAVRCGELLLRCKAAVPHGEWLPWLAANCTFRERTAQTYMRIGRELPKLDPSKAQRVADLPLRQAAKLLTTDNGPDQSALLPFANLVGLTVPADFPTPHHAQNWYADLKIRLQCELGRALNELENVGDLESANEIMFGKTRTVVDESIISPVDSDEIPLKTIEVEKSNADIMKLLTGDDPPNGKKKKRQSLTRLFKLNELPATHDEYCIEIAQVPESVWESWMQKMGEGDKEITDRAALRMAREFAARRRLECEASCG